VSPIASSDIIIGDPLSDYGSSNIGAAYVFLLHANGTAQDVVVLASPVPSFSPAFLGSNQGFSGRKGSLISFCSC
jgi:hypothetical protein